MKENEEQINNEQEEKSSLKSAVVIIIAVVAVIFIWNIFIFDNVPTIDDKLSCIGENITLYVITGCGACTQQKAIIEEENLDKFNIIHCDEDTIGICNEKGITHVPTWEINGEFEIGIKTIEQLKELTNC